MAGVDPALRSSDDPGSKNGEEAQIDERNILVCLVDGSGVFGNLGALLGSCRSGA